MTTIELKQALSKLLLHDIKVPKNQAEEIRSAIRMLITKEVFPATDLGTQKACLVIAMIFCLYPHLQTAANAEILGQFNASLKPILDRDHKVKIGKTNRL